MDYLKSLFNIEEKVAVLTGGGGILAGEMARGLLNAGAKVVLLDINEDNLDEKVDGLKSKGKEIIGLKCNVLDEENIRDVNNEIIIKFNRIDVLVNAATIEELIISIIDKSRINN